MVDEPPCMSFVDVISKDLDAAPFARGRLRVGMTVRGVELTATD
jgi:hypothetical protein